MCEFIFKSDNPEIYHKGKIFLIKKLIKSSSKLVQYQTHIENHELTILPPFKDQKTLDSYAESINRVLDNECEKMDNIGNDCFEHFNCCNCGDNDCMCNGCFSCNACEYCKEQ